MDGALAAETTASNYSGQTEAVFGLSQLQKQIRDNMKLDDETIEAVRAAWSDRTRNIHNLKYRVIRDRINRRGWTLEDALNTPMMNRSQAGHRAAKNPNWRNFTITEPKHDRPMARR